MTHDTDTPTAQTEAPAIALLSSQYERAVTTTAPQSSPTKAAPAPENLSVRMAKLLPDLSDVLHDLEEAYQSGTDRKEILQTQMQLLDALFVYHLQTATGPYWDLYMPLILRMQQHCRKTVQALAVLEMHEEQKLASKMKDT